MTEQGGLATFGETMALMLGSDVTPLRHARSFQLRIGGAESNTAIGVARRGHLARWMGRVGDDEFGRLVINTLRSEGVDVSAADVDPSAPTGIMIRNRVRGDHVEVIYYRSGSAASLISPGHLDADSIGSADVLYITGITPALSTIAREAVFHAVEIAKEQNVLIAFDPNYRSKLWCREDAIPCLRDLASRSDIVLAGADEASMLVDGENAEELATALLAIGCAEVVIREGERGATVVTPDIVLSRPAVDVELIDPVGAGDAFNAGYLSGLLTDSSPGSRLDQALWSAAALVATEGDWEGLPADASIGDGPRLER